MATSLSPIPDRTISLGSGVYTLPDAARLLGLSLPKLRLWISGYLQCTGDKKERRLPAGAFPFDGERRGKVFDFLTLVEIFVIAQLRDRNLPMRVIRQARQELAERYGTNHPFAMEGLLTDGKFLLKSLGDEALLELGSGGQAAFVSVITPFCERLDFADSTRLAERYYPEGKSNPVVVDPRKAFGRPVIDGTGITTESIASLVRGGERIEDLAASFDLSLEQIEKAWAFEQRMAA